MNPIVYVIPKLLAKFLFALPPMPIPRRFVNLVVASGLTPMWIRWALLVVWGLKTETWVISERCFFGGRDIAIGRDCGINMDVSFDNTARIELGNGVRVGPGVRFITSSHHISTPDRRCGHPVTPLPIKVGDGVWLTANVIVGPGVTIGEGSVIAMGSVITTDVEPNCFYGGSPARKIKQIDAQGNLFSPERASA